jgi:hypothetical protein
MDSDLNLPSGIRIRPVTVGNLNEKKLFFGTFKNATGIGRYENTTPAPAAPERFNQLFELHTVGSGSGALSKWKVGSRGV